MENMCKMQNQIKDGNYKKRANVNAKNKSYNNRDK